MESKKIKLILISLTSVIVSLLFMKG